MSTRRRQQDDRRPRRRRSKSAKKATPSKKTQEKGTRRVHAKTLSGRLRRKNFAEWTEQDKNEAWGYNSAKEEALKRQDGHEPYEQFLVMFLFYACAYLESEVRAILAQFNSKRYRNQDGEVNETTRSVYREIAFRSISKHPSDAKPHNKGGPGATNKERAAIDARNFCAFLAQFGIRYFGTFLQFLLEGGRLPSEMIPDDLLAECKYHLRRKRLKLRAGEKLRVPRVNNVPIHLDEFWSDEEKIPIKKPVRLTDKLKNEIEAKPKVVPIKPPVSKPPASPPKVQGTDAALARYIDMHSDRDLLRHFRKVTLHAGQLMGKVCEHCDELRTLEARLKRLRSTIEEQREELEAVRQTKSQLKAAIEGRGLPVPVPASKKKQDDYDEDDGEDDDDVIFNDD